MRSNRIAGPSLAALFVATSALLGACGGSSGGGGGSPTPATGATATAPSPGAATPAPASSMAVTSTAFADGAVIPVGNTCSGASASPALSWSGAPAATKGYALIVDDPDAPLAGGFVHWLVYDLPASTTALEANAPDGPDLAGGKQGANGRGATAYAGPCPPVGSAPHHYHFRVYALDAPLGLAPGATRGDVQSALAGHLLAQGELVGLFSR